MDIVEPISDLECAAIRYYELAAADADTFLARGYLERAFEYFFRSCKSFDVPDDFPCAVHPGLSDGCELESAVTIDKESRRWAGMGFCWMVDSMRLTPFCFEFSIAPDYRSLSSYKILYGHKDIILLEPGELFRADDCKAAEVDWLLRIAKPEIKRKSADTETQEGHLDPCSDFEHAAIRCYELLSANASDLLARAYFAEAFANLLQRVQPSELPAKFPFSIDPRRCDACKIDRVIRAGEERRCFGSAFAHMSHRQGYTPCFFDFTVAADYRSVQTYTIFYGHPDVDIEENTKPLRRLFRSGQLPGARNQWLLKIEGPPRRPILAAHW